jgi:hypothetical protein
LAIAPTGSAITCQRVPARATAARITCSFLDQKYRRERNRVVRRVARYATKAFIWFSYAFTLETIK